MYQPQQEPLFQRVKHDYGKDFLHKVRCWERTSRKIARWQNHLCYLLRCRSNGLLPPSLKLKTSVKGTEAENILRKTEAKLLSERIRQTIFTLNVIKRQSEELSTEITSRISTDLGGRISQMVDLTHDSEHRKCKRRQINKYDRLREKSNPVEETGLNQHQERWIMNKSTRILSDEEKRLLTKGMNYAISPETIPTVDLIAGVEVACRGLEKHDKDRVRAESARVIGSSRPPKSNLSKVREMLYHHLTR